MTKIRTTANNVPYIERQSKPAKTAEAIALLSQFLLQHANTAEKIEYLLEAKNQKIKDFFKEEIGEGFIKDVLGREKLRVKRFYREVFNTDITLPNNLSSTVPVVHGYNYFMFNSKFLSMNTLVKRVEKYFPVEFHPGTEILQSSVPNGKGNWFTFREREKFSKEEILSIKFEEKQSSMPVRFYLLSRLYVYWLTGECFDRVGYTIVGSTKDELFVASSQGKNCVFTSIKKKFIDETTDIGFRPVYIF